MSWRCPKCYKLFEEQPDVSQCGRKRIIFQEPTGSEKTRTFFTPRIIVASLILVAALALYAVGAVWIARNQERAEQARIAAEIRYQTAKAMADAHMEEIKKNNPEKYARMLEILKQGETDRKDIERMTHEFMKKANEEQRVEDMQYVISKYGSMENYVKLLEKDAAARQAFSKMTGNPEFRKKYKQLTPAQQDAFERSIGINNSLMQR